MKTTKMLAIVVLALGLFLCVAEVSNAEPMGTAWTYQGRLIDANGPSDGLYDFQFKLYYGPAEPNQVGGTADVNDIDVIDGYFTAELNFGSDVFDGNSVWLETGVRPGDSNDPNAFVTLSPRQEVTPVPYALQTRGIFVDKAGNVGIGTTSPTGKLHVDGGKAEKALHVRDGESIVLKAQDGADALFGGIGGVGGNIILQPGEGGRDYIGMRMRPGRVGIGTEKPDATLDVRGSIKITGGSPDEGKVLISDASGLASWESLSVLSDGDWTISGSDMYSIPTGNVGIGEASPITTLHVGGNSRSLPVVALWGDEIIAEDWTATLGLYSDESASHGSCITLGEFVDDALKNKWGIYRMTGPSSALRFSFGTERNFTNNPTRLTITAGGSVGIGTTSPGLYKLNVQGGASGVYVSGSTRAGHFEDADGTSLVELAYGYYGIWADGDRHYFAGNVGIGNSIPQCKLDVSGKIMAMELEVNGRTTTKELQIMGGADLAEPFEISDAEEIPAGAVVVIDEQTPGQLKLSRRAYDKRVAGVVSGAGGIKSGLVLSQKGTLDQGVNVALSGRVYALANCLNGPIRPGDMLTTSDTPGYVMKATDPERSYGAVIGKAMSSLQSGEGLILVLVTLQ
jgi:hypothetical protein